MSFIIFGKFSCNHVYFLCYALCTLFREMMTDVLDDNKISLYFYSMYLAILSRFLAIIPFIINKRLSKSKKGGAKQKESELQINYIYNNISTNARKNLIKSILKVAIFEFLAESLICIFYFFNNKKEVITYYSLQIYLIINTITQYLVSHLVLNFNFYKHHYLSFGINFFCTLIFVIVDIVEIVKGRITDYQYFIFIIMRLLKLVLYAFEDSYSKYALYKEFLTPFSLMTNMAVIESILLLIFSIPFIFLKTPDTNVIIFVDFNDYLKGINLLLSFGILFANFLFETFILVIIDRFSPSHLPLGFIFHSFCYNIYRIIKNSINGVENKWFYFTNFILYIILFIGAMIHNEIFIINKWGFNEKTKLFLNYQLKEENLLNKEDDEDYDNPEGKSNDRNIAMANIY